MVLDEIYAISKNSSNSFNDVAILPVYKRRYFINKLREEVEEFENQQRKHNIIKRWLNYLITFFYLTYSKKTIYK